MELNALIDRTKAGDVSAFTELTRRYQNLAFGYAVAMLHDFHLAQDATQEAFIAAYFNLEKLRDPDAFPGWLRGIVRYQCHRILRKRHFEEVPLDQVAGLEAEGCEPERRLEQRETLEGVLAAIDALPQAQREVITLFYIQEYTQGEIARFLGVPVTTVNNRLHAARARLKRRMLTMVRDTFKDNALSDDFAEKIGKIVQVQGPVIEAKFDPDNLPEVLSALTIADEPRRAEVTVQVAQRLENGVVRCIATEPVPKLRRGMKVIDTGKPIQAPVDDQAVERAVEWLGGPRRGAARRAPTAARRAAAARPIPSEAVELLETGIKVIDLLCPYVKGGKIGIFGPGGIGKLVLVEELVHRLARGEEGVSLFTFVHVQDVSNLQEGWTKDPLYTGGTVGSVQTFYITSETATDPERATAMTFLDAVTYLSRDIAALKIYPAVDPLVSRSRFLDPAVVGQEHWDVATRVRQLLQRANEIQSRSAEIQELPEAERLVVGRARKLQRFFSQPFFVAEPWTGFPPRTVSRQETIRSCQAIVEGQYDDLPEEAFLYVGDVDEAVEKAR